MINKTKALKLFEKRIGIYAPDCSDIIDQIYNSIAEEINCEEEHSCWSCDKIGGFCGDRECGEDIGADKVKKQNKDFKERLLK